MKVVGIVKLHWNGRILRSKPDAELMMGGVNREDVVHSTSIDFAEEPVAAEVKFQLSLGAGDPDPMEIHDSPGATIVFEADTGHAWVIRDAYSKESPNVKGGSGGEIDFTFGGSRAEPIGA